MTSTPEIAGKFEAKQIEGNGIQIHYVEAGQGQPLLLLHGGAVSTNPVWNGHPFAYGSHMAALAAHFRVIAPDTRACGRTTHAGGPITFDQLADDVLALVETMRLQQPMICGFSEGGVTATIVAIRSPDSVRALVNHAGYDLFNPASPSFAMMRQTLGGSTAATCTDHAAVERAFRSTPEMRATLETLKMDQDTGGGLDHWKDYLSLAFDRTTRSPGYTFDDFTKIAAPTLIVTGDRDPFCTVEEGVTAFRRLARGELAVLPTVGHAITPAAVQTIIDFLRRHNTTL